MTKLSSWWRNGFNLTLGPRQTNSEGWGWDHSVAWEQIPSLDENMPLHLWTEGNGPQIENITSSGDVTSYSEEENYTGNHKFDFFCIIQNLVGILQSSMKWSLPLILFWLIGHLMD